MTRRRYFWKPEPSWDRPGPVPLPRIRYAEAAVEAYVRRVRRRTRRMLPVIVVLVVLRSRSRKQQRKGDPR